MASAPPIRIIVLGTGDFALPLFEHLADTGHQILALVTQPDRPQGRKQEIIKSAIKLAAEARGIPVFQPENINSPESMQFLAQLGADLMVTAAYGQILSAGTLAIAPMGGINLHGSILPAYRGAAPVARAIQNGETETGVSVIRMTTRIDAGGILAIARTPIDPDETAGALEGRLAILGAPLVASSIAALVAGTAQIIPQDKAKVTRAPKLSKEDGLIDWTLPALAVHNLVRAMNPWPMASTLWTAQDASKAPLRLIIHRTRPEDLETRATPGEVLEADGDRLKIAAGKGAVQHPRASSSGQEADGRRRLPPRPQSSAWRSDDFVKTVVPHRSPSDTVFGSARSSLDSSRGSPDSSNRPAIDPDVLTCDPGGVVADEEAHDVGDVIGLTQPSQCRQLGKPLDVLL